MNETIALPQLAQLLADKADITLQDAENFIRRFFEQIENTLSVAEEVQIKGLGRFTIDAAKGVVFEPDKDFAEYLNQPFDMFTPIELDDENCLDDESIERIIITEADEATAAQARQQSIEEAPVSVEECDSEPEHEPKPEPAPQKEEEEEEEALTQATETETPIEQTLEPSSPTPTPMYSDEVSQHPQNSKRKHISGYVITAIVSIVAGYLLHTFISAPSATAPEQPVEIIFETDSIEIDDSIDFTQSPEPDDSIAAPVEIKEIVTDTVTPHRFLTTMARQYYGQMEYWVFIYLANEDKLGNPNRTRPGTVVVIPDETEFTADETPEQTLARAKRLGHEIYKRYE